MDTEKDMRILVVEPQKAPYEKQIENGLKPLQESVGGYIQAIYPFDDPVAIIVNEEGKLDNLPLNRALRDETGSIYDVTAGTMLIVGLGEEDFCSLTPEQIDKYSALYETPEDFLQLNGKIIVMPMESQAAHGDMSLIPVYCQSASYATEHGQLDDYRASHKANIACKDAIENAINLHYQNNSLNLKGAATVVEKFGADRVQYVLATTIKQMMGDGRISHENKSWAGTMSSISNKDPWGHDRNLDFVVDQAHPGLIDLFTKQVRQMCPQKEKERPSVRDQLQKKAAPLSTVKKPQVPER